MTKKIDIIGSTTRPTDRFLELLSELGQPLLTPEEYARLMEGDNVLGRTGDCVGWHWGQKKRFRGGPTISDDYKKRNKVTCVE